LGGKGGPNSVVPRGRKSTQVRSWPNRGEKWRVGLAKLQRKGGGDSTENRKAKKTETEEGSGRMGKIRGIRLKKSMQTTKTRKRQANGRS